MLASSHLSVITLLLSAALWGSSWYPFRLLAADGVTGIWAIALTELIAVAVCVLVFGRRLASLRGGTALLAIGLLGGACNTGYVIGAIEGEVMRVTLLLYLSPLWTVFLAHWLLQERIDTLGASVVALSLTGAMVMLWPFGEGAVAFSAADLWGVGAGLTYAGYNVLVRRYRTIPVAHKTLATSLGSGLTAVAAMPLLGWPGFPVISTHGLLLIVGVGVMLVLIAALMQYGLERLPATRSSVIMVSELIFATLTAWWLANETPDWRALAGGALIVGASLLSTRTAPSHSN